MLIKVQNEYGIIHLDKRVIEKIVRNTIEGYPEVVSLTNSKGQIVNVINIISENMNGFFVDVIKKDEDVLIRIYIIIKFGISIKKLTDNLINQIKKNVYDITGIKPKTVFVCIKGIKSKKVAKRDIVIKG